MALSLVMVLCLLVYRLAEHRLRTRLVATGQTVPNQLKHPTDRPTMRWMFQCFAGISLVGLYPSHAPPSWLVVGLAPLHEQIVAQLGPARNSATSSYEVRNVGCGTPHLPERRLRQRNATRYDAHGREQVNAAHLIKAYELHHGDDSGGSAEEYKNCLAQLVLRRVATSGLHRISGHHGTAAEANMRVYQASGPMQGKERYTMHSDQDEGNGKNLRPERRSLGERGEAHQRGATKDKLTGKAQETVGRLTHNRSKVAKGKAKQGKGAAKEGIGNIEKHLGITDKGS